MEARKSSNTASILYLIFGASIFILSLLIAAASLVFGIVQLQSDTPNDVIYSLFMAGFTSLVIAVLVLPGVVFAVRRLMSGRRDAGFLPERKWTFIPLLLIYGTLLGIGAYAAPRENLELFIVPVVTPLLLAIAYWILQKLGSRKDYATSRQAYWSLFGVNLVLTPMVIIFVELLIMIAGGVLLMISIAANPDFMEMLQQMLGNLQSFDPAKPEQALEYIKPLFENPWLVGGTILLLSFFVPLVEEFFKPIWLWVFKHDITVPRGYLYGLVSGGAFALFESAGYLANPLHAEWLMGLIGRSGTILLHMVTAGITGAGMAKWWQTKRFAPAFFGYLAAVLIHGLWNFFGIATGFSTILPKNNALNQTIHALSPIAPYVLGSLVFLMFVILIANSIKHARMVKAENPDVSQYIFRNHE